LIFAEKLSGQTNLSSVRQKISACLTECQTRVSGISPGLSRCIVTLKLEKGIGAWTHSGVRLVVRSKWHKYSATWILAF